MIKWILRFLLIGIVGFLGYVTFLSHQKGYFNIPDMPEGSYVISTRGGFRGIILDAEVSMPITDMPKFFRRIIHANPGRRYLPIPFEVAPWFEDAWSICTSPSEQERDGFLKPIPQDLKKNLVSARLDAVCKIDVDGKEVLRGLLYSVPKL